MMNNSFKNNINDDEGILDRIYICGFGFSILSLICSIVIFLVIILNKILRSLTYNFLLLIFFSEILNSIGNICEFKKNNNRELLNNKAALFLIPFSDIFTMFLFCYFSFCSIELIKKSNRNIKEKELKYFLLSFIFSLIYSITIFMILFYAQYEKANGEKIRFYFYENNEFNYIRFIHVGILICLTVYTSYNILTVIFFLKDKQKSDKVNSWKIAKLIKVLFRYILICLLYWFFYILNNILGKYCPNLKITYMIRLFSVSFLSLRGFLITLNTLQTNKIQLLLQIFIEIYIKHKLLYFDIFRKNKRKYIKDKDSEKGSDN